MDGTWVARRMAAAVGFARRLHSRGVSAQQRLHLAAVLIVLAALPMRAADDLPFRGTITQEEFSQFSRIIAQGIYADPIQPARASGLLHFDIGIGATLVKIDQNASCWKKCVRNAIIVRGGYVGVPRLIVAKGYGGGTISASYAKISDTGVKIYGGGMDVRLIRGSIATPEVSLRAV